jgi:hypothetical protein
MPKSPKITPNLDFPNNEPADLIAENVNPVDAQAIGAPGVNKPSVRKVQSRIVHADSTTIEEQENEDLEIDEGLENGIPERPGKVPRY